MGIFKKDDSADSESKKNEKLQKKAEAKELLKAEFGKAKKGLGDQLVAVKQSLSDEYEGIKPDELYEAVLRAGAKSKFSILHTDKPSLSVSFQTHEAEKHWDGVISCQVTKGKNGSVLKIGGRAPQGVLQSGLVTINPLKATIAGAEIMKIDGVKGKFKITLRKELNLGGKFIENSPSTNSKQASSGDNLSSQILQLKELYDNGVLSKEEFEKAKSKLLS